jgi:hypothetical protein
MDRNRERETDGQKQGEGHRRIEKRTGKQTDRSETKTDRDRGIDKHG